MLRDDALAIWRRAVDAVDSQKLLRRSIQVNGPRLIIAGEPISLDSEARLIVVGAGKAGAGMAAGVELALGPALLARTTGWVNVPADCVRPLERIHLHAGRPAGVNEPTAEGVFGTRKMLELVATLRPIDVCLVLISGGGSALMPAPVEGISLEDKQRVTRWLMQHGASIEQLNGVRSVLSRVKAGGLLRAMPAGRCFSLIVSDVVGDPLNVIASGPTVPMNPDTVLALGILRQFASREDLPEAVWTYLERQVEANAPTTPPSVSVRNVILGSNRVALHAAAEAARELGYEVARVDADQQGIARELGVRLAEDLLRLRHQPTTSRGWCLLSGGEPVVHLAPTSQPRKGGRNQELILAAIQRLWNESADDVLLLSGGTDGEDGPTDAAGGFADGMACVAAKAAGLSPEPDLAINNSYPFLEQARSLLITGPTNTNVMDLRVGLVTHPVV